MILKIQNENSHLRKILITENLKTVENFPKLGVTTVCPFGA
jgi:hypothetical protein